MTCSESRYINKVVENDLTWFDLSHFSFRALLMSRKHLKKSQKLWLHFLNVIISIVFEKAYSILLALLIAKLLPKALPPMVKAAMRLVTNRLINSGLKEVMEVRERAMVTPAPPDKIPHISPITSLQNDETRALFFIKDKAVFDPRIFFEAIELKTFGSATVTLTPTISKKIPKMMKVTSTIIDTIVVAFETTVSEKNDKTKDIIKAIRVTSIIQTVFLSKCLVRLSFLTFSE